MDEQKAAAALFGETTPTEVEQAAEPSPAAIPDEPVAEVLYEDKREPLDLATVPEEVKAIRESPDRRLFSAQQALSEAIPNLDEPVEGLDLAATNQGIAELREIAADMDLSATEIQQLRTRAEQLHAQPMDEAKQTALAVHALESRFGRDGAVQALSDARALLARDPRAAKVIISMGLGNDPDTVLMVAEHARSQISAGKLRRPGKK